MSDDLSSMISWAGALLHKFSPGQRRQLTRQIAQTLRRSQARRIAAQRAPDGTPYIPRKRAKRAKQGRIKRKKAAMFEKLRTAKHLKLVNDEQQLAVGFFGRVGRIARVHQDGLRDQVGRATAQYAYPQRVLLGLTAEEHGLVREQVLRY
ncbi:MULTISPECIES: phage virion morphogenesis protein [unclassified Undibacterium]|uniref:phage virion morphogenesis protein n=1 Tax=unclassified Undibacterium TaxID=2630295 RepID=UPI002AC907F5|nr:MULTISPECIES: phage virion morphogenesis protein [unclassified Undibacterium]MEB0137999.1 phage virion morphogenesis protein [Undibacterium sp. CCC2.1]MEB0170668.1 phage virion morphogenesis protein [Undibacterium sp. CCC1.1]MEB0177009.1 phage virion morphogenesis protein [Undibacterium sp. CCC3.4]MEB0216297.1 phage virion morphogenesis protein [Undibacterium sp. 5I2]WPX42482.1 phage virion morphogenesis protein [Undibacterium sp. CCC3.4]